MRRIFILCTLTVIFASLTAHAMMAPKYERLRQLGLLYEHLKEIADMMPGPIEKIEFSRGSNDVRVVADKCFVPVKIDSVSSYDSHGVPEPGGGDYKLTIEKAQCQ